MRTSNSLIVSIVLLSALSFKSQAADLGGDMMIFAQGLNVLSTSNDGAAMHQALVNMRQAAKDAKTATPPSLAGSAPDSPAMKGWRQAFDHLLAQFDTTDRLVQQGKLAEAKVSAQQIANIRNENHRKYR